MDSNDSIAVTYLTLTYIRDQPGLMTTGCMFGLGIQVEVSSMSVEKL